MKNLGDLVPHASISLRKMASSITYDSDPHSPNSVVREDHIETGFIGTLQNLKYEYSPDITRLDAFADAFLKKCDLGRTVSRYMVLIASEQKLMIMRPYQVYAVQHMVKCIDDDNGNYDIKPLLELSTKL